MADPARTTSITRLVDRLSRLPGLGKRSAERIAFYVLKAPVEEIDQLADALRTVKRQVRHCEICFNLCEGRRCDICLDGRRNKAQILVVEQPGDVVSIEAAGTYDGVYHVLMGRLSPLDGVGPGELNVDSLLARARDQPGVEVILGLNPTLEGDGTAAYLADALRRTGAKVSRLARGLPAGAQLDGVSKAVLMDALAGRSRVPGDTGDADADPDDADADAPPPRQPPVRGV